MCVLCKSSDNPGNNSLIVSDIIFLCFKGCHISTRLDTVVEVRVKKNFMGFSPNIMGFSPNKKNDEKTIDIQTILIMLDKLNECMM